MKLLYQIISIFFMAAFSGLAIYMWHPERPALYLVPNQLREDEIMLDKVLEWDAGGVVWIDARSLSLIHI